jgi:hypothetical protein
MRDKIARLCAKGRIAITTHTGEQLQAMPGEPEDDVLQRIKGKVSSATGRLLDEVKLSIPRPLPTTGGGAHPDGEPGAPVVTPGAAPIAVPVKAGGEVKEGATITAVARRRLVNPPTSPLNLIGKIEEWGIGPATGLADIQLTVSSTNGSQLRDLLKKLPEGLAYGLDLQKEER